jgi:hypothetical protein
MIHVNPTHVVLPETSAFAGLTARRRNLPEASVQPTAAERTTSSRTAKPDRSSGITET